MVQMRFIVPELAIDTRGPLFAVALGVVVALVGAWLPARRAMQIDAVGRRRGVGRHRRTSRCLLALCGSEVAIAAGLLPFRDGRRIDQPPDRPSGTSRRARSGCPSSSRRQPPHALLPRCFGIEGKLRRASVGRAPVRAGITVVAIAYVFAIAITLGVVIESYVVAARST